MTYSNVDEMQSKWLTSKIADRDDSIGQRYWQHAALTNALMNRFLYKGKHIKRILINFMESALEGHSKLKRLAGHAEFGYGAIDWIRLKFAR